MVTKLYVGNLSNHTTAEDLRMLFTKAGGVISVEVIKDKGTGKPKGFAFVEMISQGDAGKAVSEFNGYHIDNRRIKVMVARGREPRSNRTDRTGGYSEYKSYNQSIAKHNLPNRRGQS
ncbi:MAG: RNA recognition motif domain-containing protein [Omnitrophica WOR_2 bacterium]